MPGGNTDSRQVTAIPAGAVLPLFGQKKGLSGHLPAASDRFVFNGKKLFLFPSFFPGEEKKRQKVDLSSPLPSSRSVTAFFRILRKRMPSRRHEGRGLRLEKDGLTLLPEGRRSAWLTSVFQVGSMPAHGSAAQDAHVQCTQEENMDYSPKMKLFEKVRKVLEKHGWNACRCTNADKSEGTLLSYDINEVCGKAIVGDLKEHDPEADGVYLEISDCKECLAYREFPEEFDANTVLLSIEDEIEGAFDRPIHPIIIFFSH